jgi:DNA polymerase III sliding clamp (beta) subunit (PCNA family)
MKFEAVIEARILNGVLRAVQAVSEDCVIAISSDRVSIRVVDASNAMAIDVNIPPIAFTVYDADEGKIAVDVDALFAKTNTFAADVDVRLVWDDFSKKINISGDGAKWGTRTIDVHTVRKPPNMPNMELPLNVQIDAERFKRMVKKAGTISDHVTIGFGTAEGETTEAFYVSSVTETDDFREDVFGKDITIEASAVLDTLYSLDMLAMIAKTMEGDVRIRLGRDLPAIFDFDLGSVPITFLLAPRIEKSE